MEEERQSALQSSALNRKHDSAQLILSLVHSIENLWNPLNTTNSGFSHLKTPGPTGEELLEYTNNPKSAKYCIFSPAKTELHQLNKYGMLPHKRLSDFRADTPAPLSASPSELQLLLQLHQIHPTKRLLPLPVSTAFPD